MVYFLLDIVGVGFVCFVLSKTQRFLDFIFDLVDYLTCY